ncbi:phage tail assembly chaperone [uncultured Sphingomonas sp.]|uniref:phage tail assembly chaperone n=1 Tax=uncultured Sphingomonas sp. TaxID=158754 RepID=UPI0035C96E84
MGAYARPGEEFGSAALRLAGFCAVVFGWSPGQFWRATPAEVAAVVAALTSPAAGAGARPVDGATLARMREVLDG